MCIFSTFSVVPVGASYTPPGTNNMLDAFKSLNRKDVFGRAFSDYLLFNPFLQSLDRALYDYIVAPNATYWSESGREYTYSFIVYRYFPGKLTDGSNPDGSDSYNCGIKGVRDFSLFAITYNIDTGLVKSYGSLSDWSPITERNANGWFEASVNYSGVASDFGFVLYSPSSVVWRRTSATNCVLVRYDNAINNMLYTTAKIGSINPVGSEYESISKPGELSNSSIQITVPNSDIIDTYRYALYSLELKLSPLPSNFDTSKVALYVYRDGVRMVNAESNHPAFHNSNSYHRTAHNVIYHTPSYFAIIANLALYRDDVGESDLVFELRYDGKIVANTSNTWDRLEGFVDEDGDGIDDRTGRTQKDYEKGNNGGVDSDLVDNTIGKGGLIYESIEAVLASLESVRLVFASLWGILPGELIALVVAVFGMYVFLRVLGK